MECPKCGKPLDEDVQVCAHCGAPAPQFAAPEGFVYDFDSGQYYRMEYDEQWQPVGATWFDSVSGEYQQVAYASPPGENGAVLDEPPETVAPDGFLYDAGSGLYYLETVEPDAQSGLPMRVITWYYPQSGEYERVVYPMDDATNETGQSTQTVRSGAQAWKIGAENKKVILIIVATVLVVAILVALAWFLKWTPFSAAKDATKTGIATETTQEGEATSEPTTSDEALDEPELEINPITTIEEWLGAQAVLESGILSDRDAERLALEMERFVMQNAQMLEEYRQQLAQQSAGEAPAQEELLSWSASSVTVTASSTLPPSQKYSYNAYNVLDGSGSTAWVEGGAGNGIGEWIMLATATGEPALLTELTILNGYQRTETTYSTNARLKDITVVFSDGSTISHTLADTKQWQSISLPANLMTSSVRIIIESVYPGTAYEDACLGGIICY